jgi:four helix bundle suffix protein
MDNNNNNNGDDDKNKKKPESIFRNTGNYENLWCFQKAEALFHITCFFAPRFLGRGDRTVDQMVQAARSGKQNIIEGCKASATSARTEIFLIGVAKASLHELKGDYVDFLMKRIFADDPVKWRIWAKDSIEAKAMAKLSSTHNDAAFYMKLIMSRPPETIANIAIRLQEHTDVLLFNLLKVLEKKFLEEGGFSERMYRLRVETRNRQREEEKRKDEEIRRKAAEEARRKAEEDKRKAEEARRKAEEEARRKAEEAKRKAEEEARRRNKPQ